MTSTTWQLVGWSAVVGGFAAQAIALLPLRDLGRRLASVRRPDRGRGAVRAAARAARTVLSPLARIREPIERIREGLRHEPVGRSTS